jgi:hypothetical protein
VDVRFTFGKHDVHDLPVLGPNCDIRVLRFKLLDASVTEKHLREDPGVDPDVPTLLVLASFNTDKDTVLECQRNRSNIEVNGDRTSVSLES